MFHFPNFKFYEKGVTLIEIIVVIFLVALFSAIVISDFPKIQRQYALSRVTYKLAQDFRKTQDMGLSGVRIKDASGDLISVKGYGIYFNLAQSATKYLIYADVNPGNQKFDGDFSTPLCSAQTSPTADCLIEEVIDISQQNPKLYIKRVNNIVNPFTGFTSINFNPPGPATTIDNIYSSNYPIGIFLGLTSDNSSRTVWVNTAGLINVD